MADAEETGSLPIWAILLTKTRNLMDGRTPREDSEELLDDHFSELHSHFSDLKLLLESYCKFLDGFMKRPLTKDKKSLIIAVRAGLRLALICSSFDHDEIRNRMVDEAVLKWEWHAEVTFILSSPNGDGKCRLLASQLLSNLVTSHYEAAEKVTSALSLTPTEGMVTGRLRHSLSGNELPHQVVCEIQPNWVDMILACAHSKNRESLAGVMGALYNSIISLLLKESTRFAKKVASCGLLVSTLLRQMLSISAFQQSIPNGGCLTESFSEEDLADSATEWIALIFAKCCRLGLLRSLVSSAKGVDLSGPLPASEIKITPEHVVLLECMRSETENVCRESKTAISLFGGEAANDIVVSSHIFLAELYISLRTIVSLENISPPSNDPDTALTWSAFLAVLESLASSLGLDNHAIALTRQKLGEISSSLIKCACRDIGNLLDTLTTRNQARKSRDFVMSEDEKRIMTALVQLVGNLCFECRQNQDLLRMTTIPTPIHIISDESKQRNALHVLLSCTSLSHVCFTLREWAIVAVRNALEGNEVNQAVVAELEADQPVQSTDLGNMGIKVNMDAKGNVCIEPK